MDGTFPDILLPWRPEHHGEVLSPGCLPSAPNSGVSPLPNSEGGNTWQLDSFDEEEERVMISAGDYCVEGPCHILFVLTNIIVVATVVIKIKCGESHTASNSLDFPLSPLFSVNLAGWENLPPHRAGPCTSGNRVEIPRAWGVAWIIRVDRHLHLPLQLLAPRSPEGQGPRF